MMYYLLVLKTTMMIILLTDAGKTRTVSTEIVHKDIIDDIFDALPVRANYHTKET